MDRPGVGFDMVTFSGGKDFCGPQASGILIGKEELIHWSLLNMSPQNDHRCKLGKETIFGLLKALRSSSTRTTRPRFGCMTRARRLSPMPSTIWSYGGSP